MSVTAFSLRDERHSQIFEIKFSGEYLKMNIVEQTDSGKTLAIIYQDYGSFFLKIFDNKGEIIDHLYLNEQLCIDPESLPVDGFHEPIATCCFKNDEVIFIQVYHRFWQKSYHCSYNFIKREFISDVKIIQIENVTKTNFPIRSFYSKQNGEFYTFFRQGQGITVDHNKPEIKRIQQIT